MRTRYPGSSGYRPEKHRTVQAPTPRPARSTVPAAEVRWTTGRLPIYPQTRELTELIARLGKTEAVKRVVRDEAGGISEVRERHEPIADPEAIADLSRVGLQIIGEWPAMTAGERIQIGDAFARTLKVAEAHVAPGSLTAAREQLDALLRAEGLE